jgi:signal transduction histidine kinase
MYLFIHNTISIISIIALCGMALFIFLNGRGKTLNLAIGSTVIFVIVFVVSHVVGVNVSDPLLSRFVLMFNLSMFLIGTTNIHAVLALIKKDVEYKSFIKFLYISSFIFIIGFSVLPDLFLLPSTPKMYFPNYYEPGYLNWIRIVFLNLVAVPYMLYKLIEAHDKSKSEYDKNQYRYFSIIIIVAYAIGFMPNFLVYDILIDPIWGMSFAFIFSIPFIYAGLKYELFNIKVIAKQAFYYSLSIGIVGGIIILLNYSNKWIELFFPGYPTWITAMISSVLAVSISIVVWRNLRKGDLLRYEFITTVTHKFRTPLTGIKWATENLSNTDIGEESREQIEYIRKSTEKLVELTDLLATSSETESLSHRYNIKRNSIDKITREVLEIVKHQFKIKKISLTTEISDDLETMCDSAHIKFVIKTIIENAIQYTKEGGNINVRNVIDHDKILFSVKDNGIGINPNEIKLIFSKFYRTEEARSMDTEGMGIGLFVAKEIINRHKGKIQAESQGINKGSTFSFWIPKTE